MPTKLNPGPRGPSRDVTTAPKTQSGKKTYADSDKYTNTSSAKPAFESAANLQKGPLTLESVKGRETPPQAGYTKIKRLAR